MVKKMFRFRGVEVLLLVLAWWLAACSAAPAAATPTALPTAAVEQRTATPSVTPTATSTPTASPTVPCWAAQVAEPAEIVAQAPVGAAVEVAWQVTNTGACPWEPPLTLVALEGSDLDAPPWESTQTVPPGETLEVRVALQAPATPGAYTALWALRPAHAEPVPQTLTLRLEALPPTPTPTPTPGPPVFVQRQVDVTPGDNINFDDGGAEIAYGYNGPDDQGLGHVGDHVFFMPIYYWPPDFADCYHAAYTTKNAILNPQYQVGQAFCYTTNERRVGALHIDGYYVDARGTPHLVLTYITWAAERK
ncbi:MAG: hypothetical protein GXO37_03670 [Chloroflexi bacterium]|nr:hypothetical protein [Chloroflexota bacterium]